MCTYPLASIVGNQLCQVAWIIEFTIIRSRIIHFTKAKQRSTTDVKFVLLVTARSYKAGHYCAAPVGCSSSSCIIITMVTDPPDQLILHVHQIAVSLYTVCIVVTYCPHTILIPNAVATPGFTHVKHIARQLYSFICQCLYMPSGLDHHNNIIAPQPATEDSGIHRFCTTGEMTSSQVRDNIASSYNVVIGIHQLVNREQNKVDLMCPRPSGSESKKEL